MGSSPPRPPCRLLAVLDGSDDDARVLAHSCAVALTHDARLTVLRVWRASPLTPCAVFVGIAPGSLVADCETEAAASLRSVVADLPAGVPCTVLCRQQTRGRDVIGKALEAGIDCLIAGRRVLRRRQLARLRRRWPGLQIVVADEPSSLRSKAELARDDTPTLTANAAETL